MERTEIIQYSWLLRSGQRGKINKENMSRYKKEIPNDAKRKQSTFERKYV